MERASSPEALHTLWQKFWAARDAKGLASLYANDALVISPDGQRLQGGAAILAFYEGFCASGVEFPAAGQRAPIVNGEFALTSMQTEGGGLTCEIARRQPDGTWLWIIDQPRFVDVGG